LLRNCEELHVVISSYMYLLNIYYSGVEAYTACSA